MLSATTAACPLGPLASRSGAPTKSLRHPPRSRLRFAASGFMRKSTRVYATDLLPHFTKEKGRL